MTEYDTETILKQAAEAFTDWLNGARPVPVIEGKGLMHEMTPDLAKGVWAYDVYDSKGCRYWYVLKHPSFEGMEAHASLLRTVGFSLQNDDRYDSYEDDEWQAIAESLLDQASELETWAAVLRKGEFK